MNILNKTRCYACGPIEFCANAGRSWRETLEEEFKKIGIIVFNPLNKPFIDSVPEGKEVTNYYKQKLAEGGFEEVRKHFVTIVQDDLRQIDLCDFTAAYLPANVKTIGSVHEAIVSNSQKKPTFLICPQGKKNLPLWWFGVIHYDYFFDSLEEFIQYIKDLDAGIKSLPKRFKLLRPEYR
jgi:hypothetical protein